MRIAISGTFWAEPNTGSGQYLHHLVGALAREPAGHRFVLVIPRYTRVVKPQIEGWQVVVMPTPFDRHSPNLAKLWFEQIALGQACRKLRMDLVHVPYFAPPRQFVRPVVVTIHDLIPLLLPAYRGGWHVRAYMRLAAAGARRATAIIADSKHTRRDIIRHLRLPANRIAVTHLAAAAEFYPRDPETVAEVRRRLRLERSYVYYIGGFDVRKNVPVVVRAFAEATRGWSERPQLAIAGKPPGRDSDLFPDINHAILDAGIAADVALLGPVSAADSAALMTGCSAFLFPSSYEGFGLSPLEAMQSGAPVIAASTTSVGEVVSGGGLLVDPDDFDGWVAALRQVLTDEQLNADLRRRGTERARRFTWDRTAAQTVAVYESVALRPATRKK